MDIITPLEYEKFIQNIDKNSDWRSKKLRQKIEDLKRLKGEIQEEILLYIHRFSYLKDKLPRRKPKELYVRSNSPKSFRILESELWIQKAAIKTKIRHFHRELEEIYFKVYEVRDLRKIDRYFKNKIEEIPSGH